MICGGGGILAARGDRPTGWRAYFNRRRPLAFSGLMARWLQGVTVDDAERSRRRGSLTSRRGTPSETVLIETAGCRLGYMQDRQNGPD